MAKVPIKKKAAESFQTQTSNSDLELLRKFKQDVGLDVVAKKDQKWLILPKAFEDATQCVGIPLNTVSCVKGHTNSGKSTIMLEVIKACQKQGITPVIFDLENAIKWDHAHEVGIKLDEIVNEETGEITYAPGVDIMYFTTSYLYKKYGTYDHANSKYLPKPARETYVIEDVALCIRELIRKQKDGILPPNMLFAIDSIGCSECYKGALSNSSNNMWFAGALSVAFQSILNDLIPSTMDADSKFNNTFFYVNKIWTSTSPMGLPVAKEKGGMSFTYATRFSIFLGNQGSSGIKQQSFTYKGENYAFGNIVKIKIDKNHITNVERNGEIVTTKDGLCSANELEEYKKEYRKFLIEEIEEKTGKKVSEKDFVETETLIDD